jgi:hypothetical protein
MISRGPLVGFRVNKRKTHALKAIKPQTTTKEKNHADSV